MRWVSGKLLPLKNVLAKTWSRHLIAMVAGLLFAAAFPKVGIAGLAWIVPALFTVAVHGRSSKEAFRIGYLGGLVTALVQFYWLLFIPVKWFPILGWLALSAYLALYPATWVWLLTVNDHPADSWLRRCLNALFGAAAWVALEMLRARLFGGLPWNLLADSQYLITPLIQFAAWTGVYGISFLVVWTSLSLYNAAVRLAREPARRFIWQAEIALPLLVMIAAFTYGVVKIRDGDSNQSVQSDSPVLRVTFVQPSIPQTMIWNDADSSQRFFQLLDLTRAALTNETDLLLWPEAALPDITAEDFSALADLLRKHNVWMLLGADDIRLRPGATSADDFQYFNAAVLLNPSGEAVDVYHKRKLVMFGEYVPGNRWLPFLKYFTPITGGFTPGQGPVQFSLPFTPRSLRLSPLICFEDIFPSETRGFVESDTDFLVNLTNDGWFGESAAQWQQAAAAIFRAVENGLPLLRCCNSGLTCWVDEYGRIRQVLRDQAGGVYGAGLMTAQIPRKPPGEIREPTFYNRHGDWFGWLCVVLTALVATARLQKVLFGRKR